MLYIKRMTLVNAGFRKTVDLREYNQTIQECVREVLPLASINVFPNYYEVQTKKEMTSTEARLIGRQMGKSRLARFIIEHIYDGGFNGISRKIFKELK